ncbi:N-acetylglucosamine kinase [Flavobacterium sp. N2270]|uniref:N-acetylglucosamine kinase n=1 Tax=Flavobacterium sp. N2270 TaxID=2986831 RepID=UPI002225554A|nr:N-acetylglucosamine kinase [Flavobacterium sp. N2270]
MILLVDSGSTKADWTAVDNNGGTLFATATLGLNPSVLSGDEIIERISTNESISTNKKNIEKVFFYGAGCGTEKMKMYLKELLQNYFQNAEIQVYEDTYAAVFGTTPKGEKAIVCILGTGSNCSYFDGEKLHQKITSLGYIVMDDCSGNRFGRHIIRGYYFNEMPIYLREKLEQQYNLDADFIKNKLYKEPNPNAFLASFAKFLIEHKNTSFCKKYINEEIQLFIEHNILQFENAKEVPIHFIGSIAYYLKEELTEALHSHGLQIGNVYVKPMEGLINYHILNS